MQGKENQRNELMGKKAKYFFDKGLPVHISIRENKFYNGYLLDVCADFLIIKDRIVGELPIFFLEIKDEGITEFRESGNGRIVK